MGKKEVIIAEKPSAARKIAQALKSEYNAKLESKKVGKAQYHILKTPDKEIVIVPAVGHIYGLKQKSKSFTYPVFDIEWRPLYEIEKKAYYVKDYLKAIKEAGKNADEIIIATDYDIEGETIAYNILRFALNTTKAKRMKFSTMTANELKKAYKNALPSLIKNLAKAGETRHIIDYYFGINLSRSLMFSMKSAGRFKVMSIGRVQGPALAILAQREEEIKSFKPKPYWKIRALTANNLEAWHQKGNIFDEKEAKEIYNKVKSSKKGKISEVKITQRKIMPPHPFNLTDLQTEAYALFKITPKETQDIAQYLYENALISYPRTSSQKYPTSIPLKSILVKIGEIKEYKDKVQQLINETKGKLVPHNGKKDDEAHPAIYPTGETPKNLTKKQLQIYDLIVKRFLATLSKPAIKEALHATLLINQEPFKIEGSRIIEKGWMSYYEPYLKIEDTMPQGLKEGAELDIKKIELLQKETKPPNRYSPAGIIKELEKRKLGTKATRAVVIENLYNRGYITGKKAIEVTDLGMKVYNIMKEHMPEIISETMTRNLEEKLEKIEKEKANPQDILEEAKNRITSTINKIKPQEKEIGKVLLEAHDKDAKKRSYAGKCPKCGADLVIRTSKNKKKFIGCSNYPDCDYTMPLPQYGYFEILTEETCEKCKNPILFLKNKKIKGCVNPQCENSWYKKIKSN
ncbi:MAG: DNA topoisomerase I [Candidatus Nanohaloarchaeota archaeon]|nr:DNA topoisomerase I [Candidatus Nanohaloarchaeota archaeon]